MSKENKITPEQLEELQGYVGKLNNAATQIGNLELQKHQIKHAANEVQNDLNKFQTKLEEKYGKVTINIQVYGGHIIDSIIEERDKFSIYIKKQNEVLPWKDFNKNMAIAVEYNLEY